MVFLSIIFLFATHRTKCVRFSPSGQSWCAASSEGLLIFTLNAALVFDPFDLELDITPRAIYRTLQQDLLPAKALVVYFYMAV